MRSAKTLFDTWLSSRPERLGINTTNTTSRDVSERSNTRKEKKNKAPTNLIPTLQKHITSKHSSVMNVVVMSRFFFLAAEWWMQQPCYFWRGMKTHFSSLLMMLISSHSPNMQTKCAITNEWIVPRRWGRFKQDSLFAKHRRCTTLVTCCTLGACNRATAPGAVWAAVWAGISQRCQPNHSLGF